MYNSMEYQDAFPKTSEIWEGVLTHFCEEKVSWLKLEICKS